MERRAYFTEASRRPRSRKTEGRGKIKVSAWKRGATSNCRWKLEPLLTPFDETEIEHDCLRDPPQKKGDDGRQEITVNLSLVCSLTQQWVWTSGNEQTLALFLIILNSAKWFSFLSIWSHIYSDLSHYSLFRLVCLNSTGTFPGSVQLLQPCLRSQTGSLCHLVLGLLAQGELFGALLMGKMKNSLPQQPTMFSELLWWSTVFGCKQGGSPFGEILLFLQLINKPAAVLANEPVMLLNF